MSRLSQDLKYAARLHRKGAGFAALALCTLSIGIGAGTIAFSAVNAVLLKPLPYTEPQNIVLPWRLAPKDSNLGYSEIPWGTADFQNIRKLNSFESVAAFKSGSFNLTGSGEPLELHGLFVSSGFFHSLGVAPFLGRTFADNEDRPGERLIVLSYQLWQSRFHGDRAILASSIDLNGEPYNVIGVMPPGFEFPRGEEMPGSFGFPRRNQVWIPLGLPVASNPGGLDELAVVGRLRSGVSVAAAQAEMNFFASSRERSVPDSKGWFHSRVTGLTRQVTGDTRKPLLLIFGAVGVVMLIACVNVANLLLTRALGRRNEFAVRAALGAGKTSLVRQLLVESILLSIGSGAAGVGIAEVGIRLLIAFGPPEIPRLHEVTLDWRVLACAFTASLLCNAFFGLAPAAGLLSNNLATALRAGGRGGSESWLSAKLRSSFLVAEIALALVLVVASGLLVRTFFRLLAVDPGVHAERVLTFELSLPGRKYQDANQIVAFYNKALQGLRAMPGVAYAGIVETIPLTGSSDSTVIRLPDRPAIAGKEPYANYNIASPGYFDAVGTTLLSGRSVLDSDVESSMPVVIVNATMAKKFWPGMDPIGRKVGLGDPNYPVMQVVGVVADVKHLSLREEAGPEIYVPFTQKPFPSMLVMHAVIRSRMGAVSLAGAARDAIRQRDAEVPVANVATLSAIVAESFAGQRFSMLLMGGFGAISLTLASIGLYGVISYAVLQRTREIGIRIALGATRGMVAAMVVGQGARLIGAGILAGTVVAISVTRLLASLLFGVPPNDWLTFGVVVPLLTGVALAACYAPALRASRVEPVTALRHE